MNLTGTVQLQAVVRADGTVKEVKVIGGHPLLADALSQAVRKWKFEPSDKESVELVKFNFGQ
jgi:TonB family protein